MIKRRIRQALVKAAANSPRVAMFAAMLDPKQYIREIHGVAYGMQQHLLMSSGSEGNMFRLRRNIHRIEKGLIMKNRRSIFAVDIIKETVNDYGKLRAKSCDSVSTAAELQWAHDVLKMYFEVTGSEPQIDAARSRFQALEAMNYEDQVPFARDLAVAPPVSYDEFIGLCVRRRSVRWYDPKPVPRELIDKAMVAAAYSPSACNRQPFEFRVFDDEALLKLLGPIPMGTKGFWENFPALVVIVGHLRAYFDTRDRHLIYIDGSLAAMSFMFALETLGLSSCPINWPDIPDREAAIAKALNLEPDQRVVMLISVGYPDPSGNVPYSGKKHLDNLRSFNRTA